MSHLSYFSRIHFPIRTFLKITRSSQCFPILETLNGEPMTPFELGGLIAAPYTPLDLSGALNLPVIEKQAASLAAAGVKGAFICGTTGEGLSLTTAERMQVAQRWADVCRRGAFKVIVHVGHNSQNDCIALASHAKQVGAHAIAALPPFFFKPADCEQLIQFLRPIAAAADPLPFYYYHIPSMTAVNLAMSELLQFAAQIPSFRGIKFTHSDMMDYQVCRNFAGGRYEIAWGFDEMLLGALAVGATSAVGSTYNYAAPNYVRMIAAHEKGDIQTARQCAARSVDLVSVLLKHGGLRTGKAIMAISGIDCGPTRSPVPPLSAEEIAIVRKSLETIGFFDWAMAGR
jgi:N-acetylneuraminate lyase